MDVAGAGIKVRAICSNMRWQRGHDRPLQLGIILFAGDFFIFINRAIFLHSSRH